MNTASNKAAFAGIDLVDIILTLSNKIDQLAAIVDDKPTTNGLPEPGLSSFKDFAHLLGVSRNTWNELVKSRRAPQPLRICETKHLYNNIDINNFLRDPMNYYA